MEILKAARQWSTRPADERFKTLAELTEACKRYADESVTSTVQYGDLRVEARDGDVFMVGKTNVPARFTNYSFGQIASRVGAPAGYLTKLPATLAAQNVNHGLAHQKDPEATAKLLIHKNGDMLVRCMTSERYQRIWNYEVGSQLQGLQELGWRTPPARPAGIENERTWIATEEDCLQSRKLGMLSVKPGDMVAPAGLYASDRDMFVFMVNENSMLDNPASPEVPLSRGFILWNSEVGDKSFGIMSFLYDAVCGNHIVWGAREVKEFRVRHIGSARGKAFGHLSMQLKEYANDSANEDQAKIKSAQSFELGATKEDVISKLISYVAKKRVQVTEANLNNAYAIAENTPRYGNPNTPWAIAQGITELSQASEHASKRVKLDQAAGKILEIAF